MRNNIRIVKKIFLERKSVRLFSKKKLNTSLIKLIEKVAKNSPKAGGLESVKIMVTNDDEIIKLCYQASFYQPFVENANFIILVISDYEKLDHKYSEPHLTNLLIQNSSIVAANIITACELLDISSCYVGGVRYGYLEKKLKLQPTEKIFQFLLVGYKEELHEKSIYK